MQHCKWLSLCCAIFFTSDECNFWPPNPISLDFFLTMAWAIQVKKLKNFGIKKSVCTCVTMNLRHSGWECLQKWTCIAQGKNVCKKFLQLKVLLLILSSSSPLFYLHAKNEDCNTNTWQGKNKLGAFSALDFTEALIWNMPGWPQHQPNTNLTLPPRLTTIYRILVKCRSEAAQENHIEKYRNIWYLLTFVLVSQQKQATHCHGNLPSTERSPRELHSSAIEEHVCNGRHCVPLQLQVSKPLESEQKKKNVKVKREMLKRTRRLGYGEYERERV